jgi:hypothetical protein
LRIAWSSSKRRETNVLMCDTERFYQRPAETTFAIRFPLCRFCRFRGYL